MNKGNGNHLFDKTLNNILQLKNEVVEYLKFFIDTVVRRSLPRYNVFESACR